MSFVSAQDYEVIVWSPDLNLTWSDFKAQPSNNRAAATTASGITYRYTTDVIGDVMKVDFTITAHFYPNKSWYRPELVDTHILEHEQLHFDISEIFARKMHERMATTKFTRNVRKEVRKIYNQINKEMNDFQDTYDTETNFSRNREQQEFWKQKIDELLSRD